MFATAVIRRLASALLAAILFAHPHSAIAQGQQLSARVPVNDAPPYRIVQTADGVTQYSGIYVDILRLVAAEAGLRLEFTELPFARAFRVMEAGGADLMLGPNRSAEREAYLQYLEPPLPREPKIFLQSRLASPIRGYDDLSGRSIAVLRGASYFDRFDADTTLNRIAVDDYVSALRLVAMGRVDTVVIPELQALWLLRQTGLPLQIAPYRETGRDSYIVLSRASPLMAQRERIEAALRRVLAGEGLRRILQRYE
jgi:polar amino acid transport system substrate-binding protein